MKRDMELCRKILFAIEEEYEDVAIYNLSIDGYTMKQVAYHCKVLHDGGYISSYKAQFASDEIYSFIVGSLTWEGHDFLDKIREDTVWAKTKDTIKSKGLPMVLDVIKDVASSIIASMTTAAIGGMM